MEFLRRLIAEIHRRSLWQVLSVYVVGCYAIYQAIVALVDGLKLPAWLPGSALVLFLIGLPIVLATAMVQEGPPRSPWQTRRSSANNANDRVEEPGDTAIERRVFTWRNAVLGGAVVFAIWGVIAAGLWIRNRGSVTEPEPAVGNGAAGRLTLSALPPGTRVVAASLTDSSRQQVDLGSKPLKNVRLPAGDYVLHLERAGYQPLELLAHISTEAETSVNAQLVAAGAGTAGMVLVTAGAASADAPATIPAFLIDRYEVTNEQFATFIAAGGYTNATYWPATLSMHGEAVPWSSAVAKFVDRTGMPGPRGWSGGVFPEGKAKHPVVGVSWYEASAYARWAGKELPAAAQWWRAALAGKPLHFPWGDDVESIPQRANFGLIDTTPVGSFPRGLSPFGAYDLAGNVREWLSDQTSANPVGRRAVVGGAWSDPTYMFEPSHTEFFPPDYANDTIGFRCVRALPAT